MRTNPEKQAAGHALLTVSDLNADSESYGELHHVSFRIREREVTALLGLDGSGADLLQQILAGNPDFFPRYGRGLYLEDKRKPNLSDLQRLTRRILMTEEVIKNWTVAEYLSLGSTGAYLGKRAKSRMRELTEEAFLEYGQTVDAQTTMENLSELHRRLARIIRALEDGAKILILEDECVGMSPEEVEEYGEIIRTVAASGRGILFRSQSIELARTICPDLLIFRRGRLVKRFSASDSTQPFQIRQYLLGDTLSDQIRQIGNVRDKRMRTQREIYRVIGLETGTSRRSLSFFEGEIVCLTVSDNQSRWQIFEQLSGRKVRPGMQYRLNEAVLPRAGYRVFLRNRIVSADIGNGEKELFWNLDREDNLLIPSLHKFSAWEYFWQNLNLRRTVNVPPDTDGSGRRERTLFMTNQNERIRMILERWYIFNPRVLILYEPFSHCDMIGFSVISTYIERFANRGTAVIVIKNTEDGMQTLADQIIHI